MKIVEDSDGELIAKNPNCRYGLKHSNFWLHFSTGRRGYKPSDVVTHHSNG